MISDDRTTCGTEVGSVCKLNCLRNYRLAGDAERVCLESGEWSGKQGTCIDPSVRCLPPLIAPKNGFIDGDCVNWGGFTCTFACDDGYEISGSVRVTCDKISRRWSSATPTCVRETNTCPALDAPENGVIGGDCDGISSVTGARCRFACNPGYELEGTRSLVCQANGLWNGYVPVCVAHVVTCRPLRAPSNGYTTGVCGNSPPQNSRCTFHCNSGYELEGSQVLICSSEGRWNAAAPKCVRKVTSCRELKRPENGNFRCPQGTNIGAQCTFSCRSGFELEGRKVLICQTNGSWNGEEPVCQASPTCSALDRPQFGRHNGSCGEGVAVGAVCTFFCNSGYHLDGSQRLVCQPDGKWDNESPACVRDPAKCPTLLAPVNGTIKGTCSTSSAPA
ncbi:P-selectin-like protein, partial [Leptotrombidium deliense]